MSPDDFKKTVAALAIPGPGADGLIATVFRRYKRRRLVRGAAISLATLSVLSAALMVNTSKDTSPEELLVSSPTPQPSVALSVSPDADPSSPTRSPIASPSTAGKPSHPPASLTASGAGPSRATAERRPGSKLTLSLRPTSPGASQTAELDVNFYAANGGSTTFEFRAEWGDGEFTTGGHLPSCEPGPSESRPPRSIKKTYSHAWSEPGRYTVTVFMKVGDCGVFTDEDRAELVVEVQA